MSRRWPTQKAMQLDGPPSRPPSPELAAIIAVYAANEPHRRRCEARHWLEVTGGSAAKVHALTARISERRDQAAADQLLADMQRIQRARRHLRDGVDTAERVAELRARVTRESGEAEAEAMIEAMRLEWKIRSRWW